MENEDAMYALFARLEEGLRALEAAELRIWLQRLYALASTVAKEGSRQRALERYREQAKSARFGVDLAFSRDKVANFIVAFTSQGLSADALHVLKSRSSRVEPGRESVVRRAAASSASPVVSGMQYCAKHYHAYAGYCKDCHPDGDPTKRVCAYCGKPAQGEYAIHRDGFGEGPEVDLCNACGDCDDTVLSCEQIWEKFAKEGVCQ